MVKRLKQLIIKIESEQENAKSLKLKGSKKNKERDKIIQKLKKAKKKAKKILSTLS